MQSSPSPPSLRDSMDSQASMVRAPSVMSDTSTFEVRYNNLADSHDGASLPSMSPLATRKATDTNSSNHGHFAHELDAEASPSASPLPTQLAPHHPDYPQQQQQQPQQAFSFAAHHSVSPPTHSSASPTFSEQSIESPHHQQPQPPLHQQLSSTVRFTPTPSPAATPSSSASPPLLAHSDSPAASAARMPSQHHEQSFSRPQPQQQQQRSVSRPVPPALQHEADPFQQLSEERTLLLGSSIDMSRSSGATARSNDATLAKTMMSPAAAALASQRAQQHRESSYQLQEAEEKQQSQTLTQTVPRTPAAAPSTVTDTLAASQVLSTLSAAALSQKARKIETLIAEFDRKFLDASASSGPAGAAPTYPAWALPFVEEMATKLELVLAAQHRAEEQEGLGRSVRFNDSEAARRAAEREQARRRVAHITTLKGARQSQSQPFSPHFYPDDQYTVGLNDELPFLRDHGAFAQRRAAPLTQLASPRRNLGIDASTPRDPTLPYQTDARNKHVAAIMSSTAPAANAQSAGERPQSAGRATSRSSERYLTGLLGHDVGASTLNGLFRSTVRSPSPPHGRFQTQAYPGPTIPKAPRFAPVRPLSPPAGLRRKKEGMSAEQRRRERERELEMHALRIRCEELEDALEAERRAQEAAAAASAPGSPLRLASPRPVAAPASSLDEDALASALLRVGLANREKFLLLMQQIQSMQSSMAEQQERMNAAIAGGTLGARPAATDPDAAERHRQTSLELDRLKSELASTLSEKERLAAQVRNLASLSEKHKFALMEKQSLLSMSGSDAERKAKQDALLLRTYEQDLRAARDAITQLQGMVSRENSHAQAFKSEAASLQARLDKLQSLLGDSASKSAALSYAAGRASLKPAQKFQHLMHKYMAGFYRSEFQKLLAAQSAQSGYAQQVEVELARTKEKHALELEYQRESHKAVLEHVTGSLHSGSDHRTALETQLEQAQQELATLEDQRAEQEREMIATERLNAQLTSQLATGSKDPAASGASAGFDSEFGALMAASFKGDYLTMRNDTRMLKTVYGLGDQHILFSDFAQRIDRRNKYQQRILLLTDRHLLCFWADRGRPLRRTIPILDIQYISLSRQAANVFVLHVQDAYDYLLLSNKRAEILYHLLTLTQKLSGGTRTLQYRFGERIYVADRNKTHREVQVAESGITLGQASHRHANNPEEDRFIQMAGAAGAAGATR